MADRKNADEIEFLDFEDISTESKKTSEKADGIEKKENSDSMAAKKPESTAGRKYSVKDMERLIGTEGFLSRPVQIEKMHTAVIQTEEDIQLITEEKRQELRILYYDGYAGYLLLFL